jgi:hypothetical protein
MENLKRVQRGNFHLGGCGIGFAGKAVKQQAPYLYSACCQQ